MPDFVNYKGENIEVGMQATSTSDGLISAVEKVKLNGIAAGANNYTHPATHPPSIIAQDANNRFVTDAEKIAWNAKASTAVVTTTVNGLMIAADKSKLDGIEAGATKTLVDSALSTTSTNAIQNKIVNQALATKANSSDLTSHTGNKSNPHSVTIAQIGAAAASHNHSTDNITSGTLPVARGGTGQTSIAGILSALGLGNYGLLCSAGCSNGSTPLTADVITKIPLDTFKIISDSNVFTFSNNGVRVNRAGTIVVSGSSYIAPNASINMGTYIYKNSNEIVSQYLSNNVSCAVSTGFKIISVAAGDIIYLYTRTSQNASYFGYSATTYLDIFYIK